jgi:hypothetical protein
MGNAVTLHASQNGTITRLRREKKIENLTPYPFSIFKLDEPFGSARTGGSRLFILHRSRIVS